MIDNEVIGLGKKRRNFIQNRMKIVESRGTQCSSAFDGDCDRSGRVCIYARVSNCENKDNLKRQAKRLEEYAIARGYQIHKVVKEIGSGLNNNRKQLDELLIDKIYRILIVEHKDRLTKFEFNYINTWFEDIGKKIEVVNESGDDKANLMQDFISIITGCCTRLYGLRKSKRTTEKIIKEMKDDK